MAVEGSHLIIKPYETSEGFEIEIKDSQAREQINSVDSEVIVIKSDLAKNTARDKSLERKVDALFDIGEEITHKFETDSETAYQKDVPSGAKLASVKQIGGKTIVWNQGIFDNFAKLSSNGIEIEVVNSKIKITVNNAQGNLQVSIGKINAIVGHKYLIRTDKYIPNGVEVYWPYFHGIRGSENTKAFLDTFSNTAYTGKISILLYVYKATENGTYEFYCDAFDLTKMFGAGNEPSTVEEFEAMFPLDYYEYNEGTLMSAPVNEVVEQGKNLLNPMLGTTTCNGVTYTNNGDGTYTLNGTAIDNAILTISTFLFEKNVEYKIVGCPVGGNLSAAYRLDGGLNVNSDTGNGVTYTGDGVERVVRIIVFKGYTANNLVFKPMITTDISATYDDFVTHHQISHQIPQAILDLDGYGDSVSDDVYNYVDYENKKYYKLVGKVDLGTLNFSYSGIDGHLYFSVTNAIKSNCAINENVISNILSSKYMANTTNNVYNNVTDKCISTSLNSSGYTVIRIYDTDYTDVETFKSAMSGVMLYYELAEPVITDISDLIPEDFNPMEVEAGGTLTFKNSNGDGYRIPVPNTEEYIVKLSEVGGTS